MFCFWLTYTKSDGLGSYACREKFKMTLEQMRENYSELGGALEAAEIRSKQDRLDEIQHLEARLKELKS